MKEAEASPNDRVWPIVVAGSSMMARKYLNRPSKSLVDGGKASAGAVSLDIYDGRPLPPCVLPVIGYSAVF
jgi:hypothetical protein